MAPQAPGTNTLSIISLVMAFVFAPVGFICGIIALNQIKRTGERGRGMAITGIVIPVVSFVLILVVFALGTWVKGSFQDTCTAFTTSSPSGTTSTNCPQ